MREPQKYKFSRCETLAEEESQASEENDTFAYLESNSALKHRNDKKENVYVMQLHNNKDVPEEVNSLALGVEEGVNQIKEASAAGGIHQKALYKRFTFDFFKEDGGYMEKIAMALPK